ncbi:hypothetical protein LPB90_18480 [Chryseobacterium sp. LC2016-29]|uniref:hypothetical protein n=1 Tax=Chryseobacterium sp. LC2016-29 TaxID=2897331 RepID=UPI001E2FC0BE|nr:hypothetical protein [Chryseobacterium sp. LC2016-29]MCD0480430.1 hypothetical protein [Chryseobacterium sp. LC2016-29]
MLKDFEKKELSNIITRHRPDLTKELLQKDSFIYELVEEKLEKSQQKEFDYDVLERAWLEVNLENPIPNKTSELDLIIEKYYPKLKEEFEGLAMYNNTLISIGELEAVEEVYNKYSYFSDNFSFSTKFEEALKKEVDVYLEEEGYI